MSASHWKVAVDGDLSAEAIGDPTDILNGNPPTSPDLWKIGLSGDWSTAANWTNGVPTSSSDVTIAAFGTYTVAVSNGSFDANSLTVDAAGATIAEAGSAQLFMGGALTIDAGTVILDGNNNEFAGGVDVEQQGVLIVGGANNSAGGNVVVSGGLLELANPSGMGTAAIQIGHGGQEDGGELLATASGTFAGTLTIATFAPVIIAAVTGDTLTLGNGNWSVDDSESQLVFGTASDTGTVVWDTATPGTMGFEAITVQGGILRGGDANFGVFFQKALGTTVDAGATLDLGGANVGILDVGGTGRVTSSLGAPTLTLSTNFVSSFSNEDEQTVTNAFAGSLSLDLVNGNEFTVFIFTGTNTYSGTTTLESEVTLDIGDANIGGAGTSGTLGRGSVILNSNSAELAFDRTDTLTVSTTITGTGNVEYEYGTYIVTRANTYSGGTTIFGGATCEIARASAIGSGELFVSEGGTLVATANLTLVNDLTIEATAGLAAAHGKNLTLAPGSWLIEGNNNPAFAAHMVIGNSADDGTVLWRGGSGGTFQDNFATLEVRGGTFTDGDGTLGNFVSGFGAVTVDAGTHLVLKSTAFLADLSGTGSITGSSGTELGIGGGDFGGVFGGNVSLLIDDATILTGDSTGVSGVTIAKAGVALALGDGGTTGSLGAASIGINPGATLIIDHSDAFTLSNAITGSGTTVLEQLGNGTTTAAHLTGFDGTLDVVAGELVVNSTANNVHGVDLEGGTLVSAGNVAFSHTLSITGDVTLAATTNTTLDLGFSSWSFDADSISFGDGTHDGKIVWHTPGAGSGVAPGDHFTVDVAAGTTLVLADGNISELLFPADSTTIESGATLNIGTNGTAIGNLLGAGTIFGTGGALLQVTDGDFAGLIKGAISVNVSGDFEITGRNSFSGDYNLESGGTLTLGNIATQDAFFFGDATLAFTLGHAYSGTVFNFDLNVGQTMDFEGMSFSSATEHFSNGVLTISDGTHSMHVKLDGSFSDASFALSDDHHGGTAVNFTGTFADGDYFGNG